MSDNPTVCPYCGLPPKSTGGMQTNGQANACPAQDHTPAEMRRLLRDVRAELTHANAALAAENAKARQLLTLSLQNLSCMNPAWDKITEFLKG